MIRITPNPEHGPPLAISLPRSRLRAFPHEPGRSAWEADILVPLLSPRPLGEGLGVRVLIALHFRGPGDDIDRDARPLFSPPNKSS